MRYEVHVHHYGRPIVQQGPCAGLPNFPQHRWFRVSTRPVGLERAKQIADEQPGHAVVVRWATNAGVYDNGKPPHVPVDWLPAEA